ncbi:MAG: AAA family ATPase, partial [Deltaproteobacteria bacterium]|nr:AAA family ATPase [Deltaproteobacteria bacterium]
MKKSQKTIFTCQACGHQVPKWMGKCPECGGWDTLVEETQTSKPFQSTGTGLPATQTQPVPIDSVDIGEEYRIKTDIKEFDRVLGGGIVTGSLVLIGGDPGIGKSTLMLQALYGLAKNSHKVLYVSGEESIQQIRIRSKRLGAVSSDLFVVSEIDVDAILPMMESEKPDVLVVDSIQTMFNSDLTS